MSDAALIVEDFLSAWLTRTAQGHEYVAAFGHDGAIDALFELLNAGWVKLEGNGKRITGIVPCDAPVPPSEPLVRQKRARTGDEYP